MQEDRIVNGKIYTYLNKINNMAYIGKTIAPLKRRRYEHKYQAFTRNTSTYFYNALRRYGEENFKVFVLFEKKMTVKELNHWEEIFIALFETRNKKIGYNITKGGDGNRYIDFDTEKAINLYEKYNNAQKVSDIMNVKYCNIYGLLRNRGISIKGKHTGKKLFVYNIDTNKIELYNRVKDFAKYLIDIGLSKSKTENIEGSISKNRNKNKIMYNKYKVFYSNMEAIKCIHQLIG